MTDPRRPDQQMRQGIPLAPGGASIGQIGSLGLMKDTTGQGISSNTGTALTAGVPPGVPALKAASVLRQPPNSSPAVFFTFPSAGRIWSGVLSAAVVTANSYPNSVQELYCELRTGSGLILGVTELAISVAGQIDSNSVSMTINGLPVAAGDTLVLDINNGGNIGNGSLRASAAVLYSTP